MKCQLSLFIKCNTCGEDRPCWETENYKECDKCGQKPALNRHTHKLWALCHPKEAIEMKEARKQKEREKSNKRHKQRMKTDPIYRIKQNIRKRVKNFLFKRKTQKMTSLSKSVGCSSENLKKYLESKFQPGMSWDNYGSYNPNRATWQIDHIKPIAAFDLSKAEEQAKVNHYTNLQPLWAIDNMSKGANYDE